MSWTCGNSRFCLLVLALEACRLVLHVLGAEPSGRTARHQVLGPGGLSAGVGQLAADRDRVLRALRDEDLLDQNSRQPLTPIPLSVGLVTATGSAAFADFVSPSSPRTPASPSPECA